LAASVVVNSAVINAKVTKTVFLPIQFFMSIISFYRRQIICSLTVVTLYLSCVLHL
jgi:hypothetical protein